MDGVTREGYTFQTVLGSMGLNHMNGRVQDAITGRFLSADPYVQNPSTQSYNRYSYVNNNPLSYTDPTGFATQARDGAGGGLSDFASFGQESSGGGDGGSDTGGVDTVGATGAGSGGSDVLWGLASFGQATNGHWEYVGGHPGYTDGGGGDPIPVTSGVLTWVSDSSGPALPFFPSFGLPDLSPIGRGAEKAVDRLANVICQKSVREAIAGGAAGMAGAFALTRNPYATLAGGAFGAYLGAVGSKDSATLSAVVGLAFGIFDPLAEGLTLSLGPAIHGAVSNFLGTAIGGGTLGAAATAGAAGAGSFVLSGAGSLLSGAGARAVLVPSLAAGVAYKAVSAPLNASCGGG
jgi:RHS repeat-associated protein